MAEKFRRIIWDWVVLLLTVVAVAFQFTGFFVREWWTNNNYIGASHVGMTSMKICEVTCVNKTVLDIEEGREWIFLVRVFEVFGVFFLLVALLLAILMLSLRRRVIHTVLTYIHGAAGFFILIGVFVFLGFYSTLDKTLEADGSLGFPFAMCLLAGLVAIAAAVITGFALGKHLLEWEEDDDDEDDGLPYSQGVEGKRASVDIWEPTRREVPGEKEWAESLEADASRL